MLTIILISINLQGNISLIAPQSAWPMYVCLCKGITDTQIRAAIQDGATSLRDLRNHLGVASQCGKCGVLTRDIMRESMSAVAEDNEQLFYAVS